MASVTVLIPFLNGGNEAWLDECIGSFLRGTPCLVCRNDGELATAMNEGLAAVETEWVLPFGADDVASPTLVDDMLALSANADVVYPSMELVDVDLSQPGEMFLAAPFSGTRLQVWNYVPGGFIARTSMLRKVGGWRDLEALEDWDLHLRMYRAGARFQAAPNTRFLYRQVPGSRNKKDHGLTRTEFKAHWRQEIVGEPPRVDATFVAQATPGTTYWRCQVPAKALPGMVTQDVLGLKNERGHIEYEDFHGAAVFQFPASKDRASLILNMRAAGIRTIVEVDDNYLDTSDAITRFRAGWTLKIGTGPHSVAGHRWCVENADAVIVSTPRLAEIYGAHNANVFVCPNQIDPDDWPAFEKPDDGIFRIGWFATRSHERDEQLIRKALSWASRQPNVEVVTMGLDPPWQFRRTHLTWSDDLKTYFRNMHVLDVGLCPILRSDWARCRSDLKAIELGMAGALPIVSRIDSYQNWYDRVPSAADAREFYDRVRWAVTHRDEAREQAAAVRAYVIDNRLIGQNINDWRHAVAPQVEQAARAA